MQNELDQLLIEKRCEGNLLLENMHLKNDNKRLVELLSITDKFSDFGFLNESIPGGIRYLSDKNIKKMLPRMKANFIKKKIETLNSWIPGAAYDSVLEFNYLHNINMEEKEERNITKLKEKYQNQIYNLMKKYGIKNIGAPYNIVEVELMKKKNNKKIKQEQKKEMENIKTEDRANELINYAKTTTTSILLERKKNSDDKLINLRDKISNKDLNNNNYSYNNTNININDLCKDKIIEEINSIKNNFEKIEKEFRNRIKDIKLINGKDNNNKKIGEGNIKLLISNIEWMISSMKKYLNDIINNFMYIKK